MSLARIYPHRALNEVDKEPFSEFATFKSLFIYFIPSFIYLFILEQGDDHSLHCRASYSL